MVPESSERQERIRKAHQAISLAEQDIARLERQCRSEGPFTLGPIELEIGAKGQIINPLEELNEAYNRQEEAYSALELALDLPPDPPTTNRLLVP